MSFVRAFANINSRNSKRL